MMTTVRFSKLAWQDVELAADWYDDIRRGLGDEFLLSLDAAVQWIRRQPSIGVSESWNTRCKLLRRFPYSIFYRVDGERIELLGVLPKAIEPVRLDEPHASKTIRR